MTPKQRILAVLRGAKPDRIPWIPLLSGTYFSSLPEYQRQFGLTWRDGHVRLLETLAFRVSFYRSLGADYMDWGAIPPYEVRNDHVKVREEVHDARAFVYYETPVGTLVQERALSEEAKTVFPVTSLIRSPRDCEVYRYILEHNQIIERYDLVQQYLDIVGENGVPFFVVPSPPIKGWLLSELLLEDMVYMRADHAEALAALEEQQHQQNLRVYEICANSPADVFLDYAVTGTGMISPAIFRQHYLPYTQRYAKILHQGGKLYLNHCSGEGLRSILEMIAVSGVDGLYGISLPHFGHGDSTLAELRQALGPDITLVAGIEPHLLATGSVEQIKEATKYILDECARVGGRVMLGTVDDVPYGTPPANVAAVSEVVEKYGYGL